MDTVVLAIIVGLGFFVLAAVVSLYLQLKQIHSAVNSNMTTALNKIDELHGVIAGMVEDRRSEKEE